MAHKGYDPETLRKLASGSQVEQEDEERGDADTSASAPTWTLVVILVVMAGVLTILNVLQFFVR
jgi:hypothetical protein